MACVLLKCKHFGYCLASPMYEEHVAGLLKQREEIKKQVSELFDYLGKVHIHYCNTSNYHGNDIIDLKIPFSNIMMLREALAILKDQLLKEDASICLQPYTPLMVTPELEICPSYSF